MFPISFKTMGQETSTQIQEFVTNSIAKVLSDDQNEKSIVVEEIQAMTYDNFVAKLTELNTMSQQCLDSSGTKLLFAVKKGTDSTVFWKGTIQVACVKLDGNTKKINTYRLLNLKEFIQAYNNLKCHYSAAQQSGSSSSSEDASKLTASTFMNTLEEAKKKQNSLDGQTECIICFERKPDVLLPCTHSYCLQCIEEWNEDHDTCPICREKLDSTDDTWMLPDVPKQEEISQEIRSTLMDLAEDKSPPCSPS